MLPSRGLRPCQCAPFTIRQSPIIRASVSRKFSSLPRTTHLPTPSQRTSPLQSARWRAGTSGRPNAVLATSSVRYGSWYAPWSWGKPNTPAGEASTSLGEQVPVAEFAKSPTSNYIEPVVTSQTPELAPAGIDKEAVTNSTSDFAKTLSDKYAARNETPLSETRTIDELLMDAEPVKAEIDPTALIDHAGQLKELGLDYGFGITTMIEKLIEQIYLQTGYGWAGSIAMTAVGVRFAIFFFQRLSSDKMASLAALKPLITPVQEKLDDAIARGDKEQERAYKAQQVQIMRPHTGSVISMYAFMGVQAVIGFCAFRLLRAMAALPIAGMNQDGILWFTDLTVHDPYYLMPLLTSGFFYLIMKTGGETGVNTMGSMGGNRKHLMTGMAIFFGIVTAWQSAALQMWFLCTGILGAGTGWLLRQNGFRRFIRIRTLPSPESNALYEKVVKGELKLADIKGKDGKVRYQAPRPPAIAANKSKINNKSTRRNATTLSGIRMKGDPVPAETSQIGKRDDRDVDFEQGAQGTLTQKLDYYKRNYRLSLVLKRTRNAMGDQLRKLGGFDGAKKSQEQARKRKRDEEYEIERRRRFENRK